MVENKKDLNMVLKRGSLLNLFEGNSLKRGGRVSSEVALLKVLRTVKSLYFCNVNNYLRGVIIKIEPLVYIVSKKVGGGVYKIPVYIYPYKSIALSVRWLVTASSVRKSGNFIKNLEKELISTTKGEGASLQKRKLLHSLAVANRAYVKYL